MRDFSNAIGTTLVGILPIAACRGTSACMELPSFKGEPLMVPPVFGTDTEIGGVDGIIILNLKLP